MNIFMRFLSKILGFVPPEERKGIRLEGSPRWKVQPVGYHSVFSRALSDLFPFRVGGGH